jgi:dTDP-4-dehydrorhamnose 3,5-epimerase
MIINKTNNCILLSPKKHEDDRGYFQEIYSKEEYKKLGINVDFVQDNHSVSIQAGTLRGLHFQSTPNAQAKLVRCGKGSLYDVAVDIRHNSPTFGKWEGYTLSEHNCHQLYIPVGFAHGFISLEPNTEIIYKCSDYYNNDMEGSILWCDEDINITWPISKKPILSEKDSMAPKLDDIQSPFIFGVNS